MTICYEIGFRNYKLQCSWPVFQSAVASLRLVSAFLWMFFCLVAVMGSLWFSYALCSNKPSIESVLSLLFFVSGYSAFEHWRRIHRVCVEFLDEPDKFITGSYEKCEHK